LEPIWQFSRKPMLCYNVATLNISKVS